MSRVATPAARLWPAALARTLLAVVGGYAFTYSAVAALARLLPGEPVDVVISATLVSFLIYTLYVLWAFAVPLRRALLSLLVIPPLALIGFWPNLFAGAA
ncbi:MAG TPA: iron transporter [Pseudomonas sabulinigri]|uniref:Iron transporter n=1 Tax=marine sediment metagenome TaxID=412755 RepID=A0A0F9VIH7_9ZZZZ|nr:iron transporter [Halopseudomonas sabulinigri]HEC52724.1 iron transporter [Halopseudomonas sabulinigri]|tara:strand:+ start:4431 stop:4730 length:300 start_codon:yes stop_codon:yes gene_type:complete